MAELQAIAQKTEEQKFAESFQAAVREAEKKNKYKPGAPRARLTTAANPEEKL